MNQSVSAYLLPESDGPDARFRRIGIGVLAAECLAVAATMLWHPARAPVVRQPPVVSVHLVAPTRPIPRPRPQPAPPPPKAHPQPRPIRTPAPAPTHAPKPRAIKHAAPVRPVARPHPLTPKPAPQATPHPPVAAPSTKALATLMARYVGVVRPRIQARLRVPAMLRAMGLAGHALVEFRLAPSGRLLWARIRAGSPIDAVNEAALAAVRKTAYPAFLAGMPKTPTTFEIVVHISGTG